MNTSIQTNFRDQFVLQKRERKIQEKLLDQAKIFNNALTFDKAISLVKNDEATETNIVAIMMQKMYYTSRIPNLKDH